MAKCESCGVRLIPGSLFCDKCGADQPQFSATRRLRQGSFNSIKDAKGGILSPGELLKSRRHRYLIEEAIARSGFGATFRAVRVKDEKQVLVKQMLEQSSYDQLRSELMRSFKREAKFLRRIHHPAFPRGYEFFERNSSIYLVMEFINGKELAKALKDFVKEHGDIPDGLLIYLGIEIAEALEIVHSSGYVYRDLKPQNIMLDGISSKVKLIDFGTLYHPSDQNPLIFETAGYTPPEFLERNSPFPTSGDIFSLGAVLFEAATGSLPKPGEHLKQSSRDKRLIAIIERCLLLDPIQRFQKARTVRDELQKLTRTGFWPFKKKDAISPIELSVLPRTLFPPQCTFCEYCGYADSTSDAGYCPKCRVALRVGKILWKDENLEREFFLYADETILGTSSQCHFTLKGQKEISPEHLRIFRRKTGLWLESIEKEKENTLVNRRKVIGPIELLDGDNIEISQMSLTFNLRDAC